MVVLSLSLSLCTLHSNCTVCVTASVGGGEEKGEDAVTRELNAVWPVHVGVVARCQLARFVGRLSGRWPFDSSAVSFASCASFVARALLQSRPSLRPFAGGSRILRGSPRQFFSPSRLIDFQRFFFPSLSSSHFQGIIFHVDSRHRHCSFAAAMMQLEIFLTRGIQFGTFSVTILRVVNNSSSRDFDFS